MKGFLYRKLNFGRFFAAAVIVLTSLVFCGNGDQSKKDLENKISSGAAVIDVRTVEEFNSGHFPGAVNIPVDLLEGKISSLEQYKDKSVVLYCRSGGRAGRAKKMLEANGFKNVVNAGGLKDMPEKK